MIPLATLGAPAPGTPAYAEALCWPLVLGGELFGAVCLLDLPEGHEGNRDVLAFLEPVNALLALVLHHAMRLARQERLIEEKTRSLARSESFYRRLFDSAPYPIALAEAETGTLRKVNQALADLAGRTLAELEGQSHQVLHPPAEVVPGVRPGFEAQRHSPKSVAEEQIVRPDGEVRTVEVRAQPLELDGVPYLLGFFGDVTAQRASDEERRRLHEQLTQSQKMQALGTLAGGIAHDFNNILGAILGFTELTWGRMPVGSEEREDLGEVLRAANRAKELVKQILAFSRKAEAAYRPFEVHVVVTEALSLLRQAVPTSIPFVVTVDPSTGLVKADPTQVHQVVMNLCTNAYHAMRERGGTLTVDLRRVQVDDRVASRVPDLKPGEFARLTVADTGPGIDPQTLRRIFEPFFTTKAPGEGTGMGLSVVHGIATQTGGAVGVETVLGTGTTFQVYLPIHHAEAGAAPEQFPPVAERAVGRILLVDDEPALAQVMARRLRGLGFEVTGLTSSEEALRTFLAAPAAFDALVSDQTMPDLTGLELARRIRAARADLPVVLCTGYSDVLDDRALKDAGVDALMMKPVDLERLAAQLQRLLGARG